MTGTAQQSALKLLSAEVVRSVVRTLAPHGIGVMPLKGVLWQATLYASGESRPVSDVDLIVSPGNFARARHALVAAGFVAQPNPQGPHEQELLVPGLPLSVDLHETLFARGRYRLTTAALFSRADADSRLFGEPVLLPHPLDQLAHLLGHLATDHRPGDDMYRGDLVRLIRRERLAPVQAGQHLRSHGLGRAARFALAELATQESQHWVDACLAALGKDPLGDLLAQGARAVVARRGRFSPWSAVAGHALNSDPAQIASALGWATLARLRAWRL